MKPAVCAVTLVSLASFSYAADFVLSSPDIAANTAIPKRFEYNGTDCSGNNQSPALKWRNAPQNTKSFAITVYDPDAPTGHGWWHWIVTNIPSTVDHLPENAGTVHSVLLPKGAIQGLSDFGIRGWGGVCPLLGDPPHHYIFTVYALKTEKLNVPSHAPTTLIQNMIKTNTLKQASFTAFYSR